MVDSSKNGVTAKQGSTPMSQQFLDGTISYKQGASLQRGSVYGLAGIFSARVSSKLRIKRLNRLQALCNGDLDICRLPDGRIQISKEVIAHSVESVLGQAIELKALLLAVLGLRANVSAAH